MSAQEYWNNHPGAPQQHNYNQPAHGQSQGAYSHGYEQGQSYRPNQPSGHAPDNNEPLNWGYGTGSTQPQHQYNQQAPNQGHYDAYGSNPQGSQQYSSYDHSQPPHANQGYGSHQNYSQPHQDPYQSHSTYNENSYSNAQHQQPQIYPPTTGDHHRQPSPNPYGAQHHPDQPYGTPAHAAATSHQQYPGGPGTGPDGERGLLGAIGGAAVGGFAGHKVNHGIIGAVGGAYAGHKLEDHLKDKKKKDKKDKKDKYSSSGHGRRNSHSSSSSSSSSDDDKKKKRKNKDKYGAAAMGGAGAAAYAHHQGGGREVLAGNFSSSCTQISLDRDYDLIASCATLSGDRRLSSLSLNSCLTNSWGQLAWARGGGFGPSSRNVRLVDGGKVLEAEMGDGRGGWNLSRIRLDERITNQNGDLQFLG